jgi:hypothetical protein
MTAAEKPTSPIHWRKQPGFDRDKLPELKGVEHTIFYDPKPSRACLSHGGNGRYESPFHGTYNHRHARVILGKTIIVTWANHAIIEAGYGERTLAQVGIFNDDYSKIDWGGKESLVELGPPVIPVDTRTEDHSTKVVREVRGIIRLYVIDGKLYGRTGFSFHHGFTDLMRYSLPHPHTDPPPVKNFVEKKNDAKGFTGLVRAHIPFTVWQRWKLDGHRLTPDSPMYRQGEMPKKLEVAKGRFKPIIPLNKQYRDALPIEKAPKDFIEDITRGKRASFGRPAGATYRSNKERVATVDGTDGLAHFVQFKRPDGKWVAIRDNLKRGGTYYAALKDGLKDYYPPAIRSNLPGGNQPATGELPNGWVWFAGRMRGGKYVYLTVSEDGIHFNHSWTLLRYAPGPEVPERYRRLGIGYPIVDQFGDYIWIYWSLSKSKSGALRISIPDLLDAYKEANKPRYPGWRLEKAWPKHQLQPPTIGKTWKIPHSEIEFLPIKPGRFVMGSTKGAAKEKPSHEVKIAKPFWMGTCEVRQKEYQKIEKRNPSQRVAPNVAVHGVSWKVATSFCNRLTAIEQGIGRLPKGYVYRLPTEAEWEYCCRAGTTTPYSGKLDEMSWVVNDRRYMARAVGQKKPNPWGLHGMYGNVAEWCYDDARVYTDKPVTDPIGSVRSGHRALRGGSFIKGTTAFQCRSATRRTADINKAHPFAGFRIVLAPAR